MVPHGGTGGPIVSTLSLRVDGKPVPQGSKNGFVKGGRVVMVESGKGLKGWRKSISDHARVAVQEQDFRLIEREYPAGIVLTFIMPRPTSTPKRRTPPAVKRPDADKLTRAVLDSLTGIAWVDDSQVTNLVVTKRLAELDEEAGVQITISGGSDDQSRVA